jgi:hypothetical protein
MFVFAFQCSVGPICYSHPVETCLPFTIGPLNGFLYLMVLVTSTLGPIMMESLGISKTFLFFGSVSFIFIIYSCIFVKNTSFKYEIQENNETLNSDFKINPSSILKKTYKGKLENIKKLLSKKEK